MRVASALLLCCWMLLGAGCHAGLRRGPAQLSPRLTSRYKALDRDDLAGHALLLHDAGLHSSAADMARDALKRAHLRVMLLETAGASGRELSTARAELRDVIRMSLKVGKEAYDGGLVIAAAMAGPRIRRRELIWGATYVGGKLPTVDEPAMLEALADAPDAWLTAWNATWPRPEVEVPSSVLEELGARGNPLRLSVLRKDVSGGVLTQRGLEMASAIARTDASHLGARLLLLVRAESRAGTMVADPDLLRDMLTQSVDLSTISRAAIRATYFEESPAAALHYAEVLMRAGLHGDAAAVLTKQQPRWTTAEHRELAELTLAFVQLQQANPKGLESWRAAHPKDGSLHIDRLASGWLEEAGDMAQPEVVREWSRAALRRRVAEGDLQLMPATLLAAWQDPKLGRGHRRAVERRLLSVAPRAFAAMQICAAHGDPAQACHALSTSAVVTTATAEAYGLQSRHAATLLDGGPIHAPWNPTLEAAFAPIARSALILSPKGIELRLRHFIETAAFERAEMLLETRTASLSATDVAWARLEIDDRRSGRLEANTEVRYWFDFSADAAPTDPESPLAPSPEPSAASRDFIDHGLSAISHEDYETAIADLQVVASRLPDDARPPLSAWIAQTLVSAGDLAGAKSLASSLPVGTPTRAAALAAVASAETRWDVAASRYADAWLEQPSLATLAGWSRASAAQGHDAQRGLQAIRLHQGFRWPAFAVAQSIQAKTIADLGHLARLLTVLQDDDGALALGDEAVGFAPTRAMAIREGYAALAAAGSATEAKAIAEQLVTRLDRPATQYEYRLDLLEFLLLTGDSTRALTLARSEVPEDGVRPLHSTLGIVRLHEARLAGQLDAESAWRVWSFRDHEAFAKEHDALLTAKTGPLLGYACMILSDTPEDPRALNVCKSAWKAERGKSWQSAVNYVYLLLEQDVPAPSALAEVFESDPPPAFRPDAAAVRDRDDLSILHQNLAVWLELGGQPGKAATARSNSYAHAFRESAGDEGIPEEMYPYRHEHVRALTHRNAQWELSPAHLQARLSYQALAATDVIAAQQYANAALAYAPLSAEGTSESSSLVAAGQVADFVQLVADDLGYTRAEVDEVAKAVSLAFEDSGTIEPLAELREKAPTSAVVAASLAAAYLNAGQPAPAAELVGQVRHAYPTNAWIGVLAARLAWAQKDAERARKIFAEVRAKHPDSPTLRFAGLPESITGLDSARPSWVRTPEAFDTALAGTDRARLLALAPRYRSHTEVAADGFFPLGWAPRAGEPLSAESPQGEWVSITESARASRCEREACLTPLLEALTAQGLTHHWTRTTRLPAGEATEAMLSDASTVWMVVTVPLGGHVFSLIGSAPHERARAALPAFRLLRDGFAPLDAVLPAFRAAGLRAVGHKLTDRVRLDARWAHAEGRGASCSLGEKSRELPGHVQAEILLDLYLASESPQARARVLACAPPSSPAARRMGLVALLDDDAHNHAWGARAVHSHSTAALDDARVLLTSPLAQPISAANYFTQEELPPRGRIELALALPASQAERFVASLFRSADQEDARVAWVIASQRPSVVPLDDAAAALAHGERLAAELSAEVLRRRDRERYAEILRERFDALERPSTVIEAATASWLADRLAALADASDTKRLAAAAKRLSTPGAARRAKPAAADDAARLSAAEVKTLRTRLRNSLERIAKRHRRALEIARDGEGSSDRSREDTDAAFLAVAAQTEKAQVSRTMAEVSGASLSELLPGPDWTFARVASPGLFARTLEDLTRRLDPDDKAQRLLLDRVVESAKQSSGFGSLLEGGGLDVSAPIECASPAGDPGFVCTATVLDKNALLTDLGRRNHGHDAGISIPLQLSTSAVALPAVFGALPAVLHAVLYSSDDSDDSDDSSTGAGSAPAVPVRERMRRTLKIGAFDLHYYAIIEHTPDAVSTDAERYLFLADRVFVFSTPFVTRRVLMKPPETASALASSEAFQTLTSSWGDGSALQATSMGRASLLPSADVSAQVVVDGQGLAFRYGTTTSAAFEDISPAWAALPPGAIATLGAAFPRMDDADPIELDEVEMMPTDVLPPVGLLHKLRGGAFGWYGEPGDSVWQHWVLVLPSDPTLLRTAQSVGLRKPGATPKRSKQGVHYAAANGLLYLASDRTLLDNSLAQPRNPAAKGTVVFGRGRFDGTRAGPMVASLPAPPDVDSTVLRFVGGALTLVRDVHFAASWHPETQAGLLEGRMNLALRSPEDNSEVIDQWLASSRFRNAAALPRPVGAKEAEGTLVYELAVDDPEAFAKQSIIAGPRVRVEVRGADRVLLTVHAAAPQAAATEALSEARKKSLLASSKVLRIKDPSLRTVTQSVIKDDMSDNAKADAIVTWVHERIDYEVVPRSVNAVEILELGRGDCSEYARLTVAMLRAAGIPSEVRSGMAAQGSEMVAHAWVAYHDGERWHEVDPTWGRSSVTAGHLPLEVMDVLALISLDSLAIESIRPGH